MVMIFYNLDDESMFLNILKDHLGIVFHYAVLSKRTQQD
jgi:hypothetical protein